MGTEMESDEIATITDPADAAWVAAQRVRVVSYLAGQNIEHADVSMEPRWFLSPFVAIWAVQSMRVPDRIGWWAISGDLPTDYLTCCSEQDDADVLLSFSRQWKALAAQMSAGVQRPDYHVGPPGREKEFAPLLLSRAEALDDLASDLKGVDPDTGV